MEGQIWRRGVVGAREVHRQDCLTDRRAMTGRLENRVALVFGAGSSGTGWGNGKAAAVLYGREGACVIAVALDAKAAEETAEIIVSEGNRALALTADVTRSAEIASVVAE